MQQERVKIYIDGGNTYKALFKEYKNFEDNSIVDSIVPKKKKFNFNEFASFLVSSTRIKYIRSKGKKVEYIGFSNFVSFGMMKECDDQRILGTLELQAFIS
jgi:hypothetical protein